MGLALEYLPGQTPLDEDEKDGLLIPTITTRGELDEFEQGNIEEAIVWWLSRSFKTEEVFTESFIRSVHKRMYGSVWKWAGDFRRTNKNIGVDKWEISTYLQQLMDDTRYWIKQEVYPPDEIAIRFKHRLVSIHCFPNGNGRHSRLLADLIAVKLFRQPAFTWGAINRSNDSGIREKYLKAVRDADKNVFDKLFVFAKS
jgi:Fic-DOC domain mobile mystery protein B